MALRGMLTQNIDREEAEDYSANTDERKEPVQKAYTDKELSVENEQIICPGCGKVLDETSKFCRFCGTPLAKSNRTMNSSYEAGRINPYSETVYKKEDRELDHRDDISFRSSDRRTGAGTLGALYKRYAFAYRIYIGAVLSLGISIGVISYALIISQDFYVRLATFFGDNSVSLLLFLGIALAVLAMVEFLIRKNNVLEVYEYGVRGKGSKGGLLSAYNLKPYQFYYDEIIKVENQKIGLSPGVCITARSNGVICEVCSFVRDGDNAVYEISQFIKR